MRNLLFAAIGVTFLTALYLLSNSSTDAEMSVPVMDAEFHRVLEMSDIKISTKEDLRYRYQVYKVTKKRIEEANAQKLSYTMGFNKFSLLTFEEFKANVGLNTHGSGERVDQNLEQTLTAPTIVNWKDKYDCTPVKNQQMTCNAGYAMAVAGVIESSVKKYRGEVTPLSSQQIVDCTVASGNSGCRGGYINNSLEFVKKIGLATEFTYPYIGIQGICKQATASAGIKGYYNLQNEVQMMTALNSQPIVISFEYNYDLQHYTGGIYYNRTTCGSNLNHFGVGVGYYYNTPSDSYWLIKNSFGNLWGMAGYLKLDLYSCGAARNTFNVALTE